MKSKRDQIRDAVEELLRRNGRPMHNTELAGAVLSGLGLAGRVKPKDLNTALHDDPQGRFARVGRGVWALKEYV